MTRTRRPTCTCGLLLVAFFFGACAPEENATHFDNLATRADEFRKEIVVGGYLSGEAFISDAEALDSWKAECADWLEDQRALVGSNRIVAFDCGDPESVGGGGLLLRYESEPEITLASVIDESDDPIMLSPEVEGASGQDFNIGMENWTTACSAKLTFFQEIFAERFAGGACQRPTDVSDTGWGFRATIEIYLVPLKGEHIIGTGFLSSRNHGGRRQALDDWEAACELWMRVQVIRTGIHRAESLTCGVPVDVGDGYWRYASEPQIDVVDVAAGSALTKEHAVAGGWSSSQSDALASWRAQCEFLLDEKREELGAKYLLGLCDKPQEDEDPASRWIYSGNATLFVRP